MSRYTQNLDDGTGRYMTYGFDKPMSVYFGQLYDPGVDGPLEEVEGRPDLFHFFDKHKVTDRIPEEHKEKLFLDLPF